MTIGKRTCLAIAAFATALPLATTTVHAATTSAVNASPSAKVSGFDRAIELYLQRSVALRRLPVSDAAVVREQLQMQFNALTRPEQAKLLAATVKLDSDEAVQVAIERLNAATVADAKAALAEVQAASRAQAASSQSRSVAKLGGDGDLVFVATAGPCRVYDSRNGPGQLFGGSSTQVWVYSVNPLYSWAADQGGTGTASTGNCIGSTILGTPPASVVATITVLNTPTAGALRAWNGGTTLVTGAALAWEAGARASNTTVIPVDRAIAPLGGSGLKRDIGINNNSPGSIDVVIDVVGYFIENQATALDCQNAANTSVDSSSLDVVMAASACAAGYSATGINCATSATGGDGVKVIKSFISPLAGGPTSSGTCRFENTGGGSHTYWGYLTCCRVPGR